VHTELFCFVAFVCGLSLNTLLYSKTQNAANDAVVIECSASIRRRCPAMNELFFLFRECLHLFVNIEFVMIA